MSKVRFPDARSDAKSANADSEYLSLAAEFPTVDQREWRKLVDAALKGASFDERLVSRTYDELRVEPLYPRAANVEPVLGRDPAKSWTVMQRIGHPDPKAGNAQILEDLKNGATGLALVFAGSINANGYGLSPTLETLEQLLDGVSLDTEITIDFDAGHATHMATQLFCEFVNRREISPSAINLRTGFDPIGSFASTGTPPQRWKQLSKFFATNLRDLATQGYRGPFAVADGRMIHNAGGSEAQELAFALAIAVDYLRALESVGVSLDAARSMIYFRLVADADQLLTIAKFRAIRKLWARVEESCGLRPKPAAIAAETAWRMMTKRDVHTNMLRNTIATAAAGLGGADIISVLPHTATLGLPDGFARRVARNTQFILLEESHLAKVADPAAGSGAIEDLTVNLCHAAWIEFQIFEKAGGAWAALEQGIVQRDVAIIREKRRAAIAHRQDAITGVSDYPNLSEERATVLDVAPAAMPKELGAKPSIEPLPSIRLADPFEQLRDKSDAILAKTGSRPKIFIATLGPLSEFLARANFAKNFYAAGGIETVDGIEGVNGKNSFGLPPSLAGDVNTAIAATDFNALITAFKGSGTPLACLVSSDKIYEAEAMMAAKTLTDAGAIVHLAGRPGQHETEWRQTGIRSFIFSGCNALAILEEAYDILRKTH